MRTHRLAVARRPAPRLLAGLLAVAIAPWSLAPAAAVVAPAAAEVTPAAAELAPAALAPAALAPFALAARSGISLADGAGVIGATQWHAAGYTGAGVRVGIIDGGFSGISSLPEGTFRGGIEARCFLEAGVYSTSLSTCDATASDHGTAVAETVAATAPGARILIANPISYYDLKATIGWMTSRGVRIVNASINSGDVYEGPGDGTSPYADAYYSLINATVRLGALWVGAAGNSGDGGWSGPYVDADDDDWVDFAPADQLDPTQPDETNAFSMEAGARVRVGLRWPDTWGKAAKDLDLYLFPEGSEVPVARAVTRQSGSGYPVERLTFRAPVAGRYELAVRHRGGGTPPSLELLIETQGIVRDLEYLVAAGTLPAPADTRSSGAIIVGAVDARTPDTLEDYSSRGPTIDGRIRPDLVAPDCADTSVGAFCGTSQATPYATGAAALLLQADPTLRPSTLAAALRAHTIPLPGAAVPDPASGWGRLWLGEPPAVPPPAVAVPVTGVRTISATGTGGLWRGLATGPASRLHTAYTDTSGSLAPGSVVVYRGSTDGGVTFAAPVRLSSGSVDAAGVPVPAAHAAVAAGGSLVAAAWLEGAVGSGGQTTVFVAVSADGGATWGPPVAVSPGDGRAGRPAIATEGATVAVTWTDRSTGRVSVAVSEDGGASWPTQVNPATTGLVPFGAAFGRDALPAIALARGTLHLAWSSTGSRIVYRRSADLGLSWSGATTLDALAVGGSRAWLAASGSSVVVGYAARQSSGGRVLAYIRASSTAGATWRTRSLVAATTSLASSYPVATVAGSVVRVAYAGCTTGACSRSRLWYRQSSNLGRTWSSASALTANTANARPGGLAATGRVYVLYGQNASTASAAATIYLRVR